MAMTAAGMKAKIKAAYLARTGQPISEGIYNVIEDLCQGIIDEIVANAELTASVTQNAIPVTVNTSSGVGATTSPGTVTGKVK